MSAVLPESAASSKAMSARARVGAAIAGGWHALRARLGAPPPASPAAPSAARPRARAAVARTIPVREWISVDRGQPARLAGFDRTLVLVIIGLLALGLVMVYSASVAMSDSPKFARYTSTYFLDRHLLFVTISVLVSLVVVQVPVSVWERLSPWIFVAALLLLVLVLVPFIGRGVNGARRWIPLGFMSFQPSELCKLAMAMYAAGYMVRRMDVKENFFRAVLPMALSLAVVGLLLLAEPDMGAFLVIATIAMGILFLGGVNGRMFLIVSTVLTGAFVLMITTSSWRRERIFAYLNPWDDRYTLGKAYQLSHSLIAFGRGEIFGQGLGSSIEKLHYLPEAHTDFLLAVICEELGFVGVAAVVFAFFWLARRLFHIGRQAIALDRVFAGLFAQGAGIWVGGQAFINMGVNLGVLPTKGLTLPLMSYGGSAIVMNLVALAIVVRIDIENRQLMRGGRA
ncbi:MAG TPA: putative lipid II flippase FtsW [Caldimonas sp.]|nr:putative lipid II flippase FtsW [Caldimonas sp.]